MHMEFNSMVVPYIVSVIFLIAATIIFVLAVHLTVVIARQCRNESTPLTWLVVLSLIGISFFLATILCLIATTVELILEHGYALHGYSPSVHIPLEHISLILDYAGHLCMVTVFTIRLHLCFEHSIFEYPNMLKFGMFAVLLFLISFWIMLSGAIFVHHENSYIVIACQIVFDLCVESVSLWILYLFVSTLYDVLKMSLKVNNNGSPLRKRHQSDLSLFNAFSVLITPRLQRSRSKSSETKTASSDRLEVPKLQIDGGISSGTTSSDSSSSASQSDHIEPALLNSQITEITAVMNKMTLLVIIEVFTSIFSVIGNTLLRIHLRSLDEHGLAALHCTIFAYLLRAMHMFITSWVLYLQFNFTEKMYQKLFGDLDLLFLKLCLKLNLCCLKRTASASHSDSTPVVVEQQTIPALTDEVSSTYHVKTKLDSQSDEATAVHEHVHVVETATEFERGEEEQKEEEEEVKVVMEMEVEIEEMDNDLEIQTMCRSDAVNSACSVHEEHATELSV